MNHDRDLHIIAQVLDITRQMSSQHTGGVCLEDLTVQIGPRIREWDINEYYLWPEPPECERYFSNSTKQDVGIDTVAVRDSGDAEYIAIQCKACQLGEDGEGNPLDKYEIDSFGHASSCNPYGPGDSGLGRPLLQEGSSMSRVGATPASNACT